MLLYYFLISLYALLASAGFDIYLLTTSTVPVIFNAGWQVVDPNRNVCPAPLETRMFPSKQDVSGNKIGIRCETFYGFNGCDSLLTSDPAKIDVMEMHFSDTPKLHWSKLAGSG